MEEDRELTVLSGDDHPDKVLQRRIANGEVTQEQVERVWQATSDLSAQTTYETRLAVMNLRKSGYKVTPAENMILNTVLDLRAALYRDESKFSHLVAGSETIVEELRKVGTLSAQIQSLNAAIYRLESAMGEKRRWPNPLRWFKSLFAREEPVDESEVEEAIPQEPYNRRIGSSWDASNPRKM